MNDVRGGESEARNGDESRTPSLSDNGVESSSELYPKSSSAEDMGGVRRLGGVRSDYLPALLSIIRHPDATGNRERRYLGTDGAGPKWYTICYRVLWGQCPNT